jgi:catechol 2,3-dioxygenase-like lactoylglutathione lyase family enzyme
MEPMSIQLNHITIRVRNLQESATFYCSLFGMVRRPADPPSERSCICHDRSGRKGSVPAVVLVEGLAPGSELLGLDHFGLRVPFAGDVFLLYQLARNRGFRATTPTEDKGVWKTFIFDPDGYKVEVAAAEPSMTASTDLVRQECV